MFGFGVLPSTALFVSLWFLFETPRWLVFHGDVNAAQEILKKIRPYNTVEIELSNIIKEHESMQQSKIGKKNHLTYRAMHIDHQMKLTQMM